MTATTKRNGFSLEEDLMPILDGKVQVPNYEEIPVSEGVAFIAAGGGLATIPGVKNAKLPDSKSSWGTWARYFLGTTQGGTLNGTGYVMTYASGNRESNFRPIGRIGRFAVCKHEYVNTGTRERERRGFHSGYCAKCGLDMSVDSSD